ncbi:MAG: DUF4870 domain-containing protein [Nanoarchaeota archaeon]
MPKRKRRKIKEKNNSQDNSKLFAFLAVFLSIIGFIIALLFKRDDKYVMFYAKQSLVLFIFLLVVSIANQILMLIPILGRAITFVTSAIVFILWIIQIVYSLSGEQKKTHWIGKYADRIRL